ncbi:hypothetical protein chiPu_0014278 [Chiloscyllium punctatum]|uniref:Uncharacterized protein n=1 Tax=Chiloscyllium punctatum TaxID=137246 RepID=A0A401SZI1_CHIPU|nr:hypothetical protein [Chiloscyllium punctatum]
MRSRLKSIRAVKSIVENLGEQLVSAEKVKSGSDSGAKKPKCITVETKKEIIAKHENGARVSDLAMQYDTAKSTICTILKNKEAPKAADVAKEVTIITKQRPKCFLVTNDTDLTLGQYWKDHFNILHCISLIDKAYNEVSFRTLQSAWRKLWPACVPERDFEGFEEETSVNAVNEIVTLGQNLGLEVEEDDVAELVEDHRQELSTDDLAEVQQEQMKVMQQEHSGEEEDDEREDASSVQIKDICSKWSEVQAFGLSWDQGSQTSPCPYSMDMTRLSIRDTQYKTHYCLVDNAQTPR